MIVPSPTVIGAVRLVWFSARSRTWVLDAVIHLTGDLGAGGTPITIEVERPDTIWFEAAMEQVLERWARDDRIVTVRVAAASSQTRIRFDSEGTSLQTHLVRVC